MWVSKRPQCKPTRTKHLMQTAVFLYGGFSCLQLHILTIFAQHSTTRFMTTPRLLVLSTLILAASLLTSCTNDSTAESATAAPAEVAETSDYLTISSGPLSLSVDLNVGARVASFTYQGKEVLKTTRDANNWQWGSTVWVSPQSFWNWPPIPAFEQNKFSLVTDDNNRLMLVSDIDTVSKLQVTKSIRLAEDEQWGHVATLRYRIYNRGNEPQTIGVWENTRVPFSGYVEYPTGATERLKTPESPVKIEAIDEGMSRISFTNAQPDEQKVFYNIPAPTEGRYVSHSYVNNGLRFKKSWKRPASVAPEQERLEIYLAKESGFGEIEIHGQNATIQPGEKVELTVFWQIEEVD